MSTPATAEQLATVIQLLRTLADMVHTLAEKVTSLEKALGEHGVAASQVQPEVSASSSQGPSRAAAPNPVVRMWHPVPSPDSHPSPRAAGIPFPKSLPSPGLDPVQPGASAAGIPFPKSLPVPGLDPVQPGATVAVAWATPWGSGPEQHLACNNFFQSNIFFRANT